ncbi:MAG: FtsX-like permease family protein [Lachnospiraceae bacterium]|nr:FtsX-like permease family protein [Lachnospiraceae bacterium]
MKKSMMWTSTLREIKQSLGRYLAILGIVALGVGFFAGIKVTKPAMIKTADAYFSDTYLYDFHLISTLGFDDKNLENIRGRNDVKSVQGAYSFDILCQSAGDGNVNVIKAHSITDGVNELKILYGRLPVSDNECVVDSSMYSHKYVGKKIKLSDTNKEEDLEHFTYKEYKIVGVVESPLYVQFERGSSALGNGKVSGFVYLRPEGFQSDAYTEVYVKLNQDFHLYADEYDEYMEEKKQEWESYLDELGTSRYENLLADSAEKLEDAKQELAKEEEKGRQELEDAALKLEEARIEIEDGRTQIEEAKAEILDGKEKLEKEEKKLNDAVKTIAKNEKLLLEKEAELEDGIKQWEAGNNELAESLKQWEEGNATIADQESQLVSGEQQLAEKEAELIAGEEQFATMETLVNEGLEAVEQEEAALTAREQEWMDTMGFVPEYIREQIDGERELLNRTKQTLLDSKLELDANREQLVEGRRQVEAAKEQLKNGRKQLEDAKKQMNDGKLKLDAGDKDLETAWAEIKNGRKQISEGRKEILVARQEVEDGKRKLVEAKEELAKGEEELEEKEQELLDGEKEYQDGLKEYEDGLITFEEEIADARRKIKEGEEELEEIEMPQQYLLGRDTNMGYVLFQSDSDIVENVSTVFPVFFFLVAALVCMTTMSRMIEEQRTQIGTLKALGYGYGSIMGKYMFYSGSAAVIGCVGGYLIGIILFPFVIWECYGMMYDLGGLSIVFEWKLACISLAVSLLCSVGTTWYSCRRELNEMAAQLMRPKTPQAGKRILLERIPLIWNRLKFLQKVSIRNVFRYKKRFFMMVLGISGCAALVLAAFGIKDSIADVMKMQYEEIQVFDMSVMTKDAMEEEQLKEMEICLGDAVSEYGFIQESSMELVAEDMTKDISLIVFEKQDGFEHFIDMHTMGGETISMPALGEAVITYKMADRFEIEIGDEITLRDEDYREFKVTVSGIMQNFVGNYLYVNPQTYDAQLGEKPEYKNLYLNVKEGTDMHQLSADLMKLDTVTSVTINEVERQRFEVMMSTLDYIVILVLVCAAALAFIVIYNLTNINITERIREIATIKVLGFYKKETATYVFRENIMLAFVGALVGLGLGKILHTFIMECIQIDMVCFDIRINGLSYLYSVLLTLFFALCVNKLMEGKLEKISMTESLKSVD